jgi:hypothetical protein
MPKKKKALPAKEIAKPKVSDGIVYSIIIALLIALISGIYFKSSPCISCRGENIANGYPYPWFSYNTYEGWQRGNINWLGAILDIAFWAFIAYVIMLVFYAALKEF